MSDRHIDLDEIDNAKANPVNSTPGRADFVAEDDFEPASNRSRPFGNVFRQFMNRSNPLDEVLPPEARRHFRASQRELLLGWRSIIDQALTRLDKQDARDNIPPAQPNANPNKIIVEEMDI